MHTKCVNILISMYIHIYIYRVYTHTYITSMRMHTYTVTMRSLASGQPVCGSRKPARTLLRRVRLFCPGTDTRSLSSCLGQAHIPSVLAMPTHPCKPVEPDVDSTKPHVGLTLARGQPSGMSLAKFGTHPAKISKDEDLFQAKAHHVYLPMDPLGISNFV